MKVKTTTLVALCAILLSFSSNAYACDDVIILDKAKKGEIAELKAYLKTCRLNEKRKKNAKLKSILKNCAPVLTKEEKKEQDAKDEAYDLEIKRLKEKTKDSLRSVDKMKKHGRWD